MQTFIEGVQYVARFWEELMQRARQLVENAKATSPRVFYHTTITMGRYVRDMAFNSSKRLLMAFYYRS